MKEIFGNLWDVEADLRVITTNGDVNGKGAAVMGRGCAREASRRIPSLERRFAELLSEHGNRVMRLARYRGADLASFPVKHHWHEQADPELIRRSAHQLVAVAEKFDYQKIVIPRPGCGNGALQWNDVRAIVSEILDDHFRVITFQ